MWEFIWNVSGATWVTFTRQGWRITWWAQWPPAWGSSPTSPSPSGRWPASVTGCSPRVVTPRHIRWSPQAVKFSPPWCPPLPLSQWCYPARLSPQLWPCDFSSLRWYFKKFKRWNKSPKILSYETPNIPRYKSSYRIMDKKSEQSMQCQELSKCNIHSFNIYC